jgi:hypothetical protein
MLVYNCDACKRKITDARKSVTAGVGYDHHQLCLKSGAPIVRILKNYKLAK